MNNFSANAGKNSVSITSKAAESNGMKVVVYPEGKSIKYRIENSVKGKSPWHSREHQYASYIGYFVACLVELHLKGDLTDRFKKAAEIMKPAFKSETFRALSNMSRRITNTGALYPIGLYFHEGAFNDGTKTVAPAKTAKAPVKPAEKVTVKPAKATAKPAAKPAAKKTKPVAKTPVVIAEVPTPVEAPATENIEATEAATLLN